MIVLAVCSVEAVVAFPVTFPVRGPLNPVAIIVPESVMPPEAQIPELNLVSAVNVPPAELIPFVKL